MTDSRPWLELDETIGRLIGMHPASVAEYARALGTEFSPCSDVRYRAEEMGGLFRRADVVVDECGTISWICVELARDGEELMEGLRGLGPPESIDITSPPLVSGTAGAGADGWLRKYAVVHARRGARVSFGVEECVTGERLVAFTVSFDERGATEVCSPVKEIVYRFQDASVPPEDHRSFTITLRTDRVSLLVDSYGRTLAQRDARVPPGRFQVVLDALRAGGVRAGDGDSDGPGDGSTGGTSEFLTVRGESGALLSGRRDHCEGRETGTLHGDISSAVAELKKLIPRFDELISG